MRIVTLPGFFTSLLIIACSAQSVWAACPKNLADWDALKLQYATALASAGRSPVAASQQFFAIAESCAAEGAVIPACIQPLRNFAAEITGMTKTPSLLGFNVSDAQYFKDTASMTDVPSFLQTPELLQALSDPDQIPQAILKLQQLNLERTPTDQLLFFRYRSQHLATPDRSHVYGRVLVIVPGNPEKWVQFGIPEKGLARTQNLSVVSVFRDAEGRSNVFFKDHYRVYNGDGSITVRSRLEAGGGSDTCINCHKSGVLPIFPAEGSFNVEDAPKILQANQMFRKHGAPHFASYLDAKVFGPGIGSIAPDRVASRTDSFMQTCTTGLTFANIQESLPKIRNAMTCAKCHNGDDGPGLHLGELNFPINPVLFKSYVMSGKMPTGASLDPIERQGLMQCLEYDYFHAPTAIAPHIGQLFEFLTPVCK
jgi:hypothetical protein